LQNGLILLCFGYAGGLVWVPMKEFQLLSQHVLRLDLNCKVDEQNASSL